MFLEKKIQNIKGTVSRFEDQLAKDGSIPNQPNALQSRNKQLQVLYFIMQPKTFRIIWECRAWGATKGSKHLLFLCYAIKQVLRKDVASTKDELNNLGKELDLTQQASSSLQRSFNEYCPDIRRQENEVKGLKSRYTTVDNQLQGRWEKTMTPASLYVHSSDVLSNVFFFTVFVMTVFYFLL